MTITEISDHALTALALREHAQTSTEIAERAQPASDARRRWTMRAARCRALAVHYENLATRERVLS
jgi:hypothetical protein